MSGRSNQKGKDMKRKTIASIGLIIATVGGAGNAVADQISDAILKVLPENHYPGYPGINSYGEKCSVAVYGHSANFEASILVYSIDVRGNSHGVELYTPFADDQIDSVILDPDKGRVEVKAHIDETGSEGGVTRVPLTIGIQGKSVTVKDAFEENNCTIF